MKINKKIIKELSDYLEEFNLTELEYTEKDTKIKVSKNNISINNQNIPSLKTDAKNFNVIATVHIEAEWVVQIKLEKQHG